jgi:hypothetical protein
MSRPFRYSQYARFRAEFVDLRQQQAPWWTDKTIWQERDNQDTVSRPTEELAFTNIAHECRVYTRREINASRDRAVVREVLADMQQEQLLKERLAHRNLSLKERLTARGMTLMWMNLDTKKRHIEEVYILP